MTDYNNPNTNWMPQGYDPYKGMSNDDKLKAGCLQMATFIAMLIGGLLLCALLGSCTTTKYVPVERHTTEHHWHTDTVRQTDSIIDRQTTLIREVDSATMAQYGIQMERNQRAWLILQREMEQRLRELEHTASQKDTVRDSIPYPVEVIKEVERNPSAIERGLMIVGCLALFGLIIFAAVKLRRFLPV